jgi:hypothetical protein
MLYYCIGIYRSYKFAYGIHLDLSQIDPNVKYNKKFFFPHKKNLIIEIMKIMNFFNIEEAVNSKINSHNVFIIANEKIKKDKTIGRQYTVFLNFTDFLKNRTKYKHCHEIIVDHKNNQPNLAGRLVFDFDIKYNEKITIPSNFKIQVQNIIIRTIENFYVNVDTSILQFVWSTSENPNKLSKHLTVKNLYFEDWITMTKIFYQLFCHMWNKHYDWIHSDELIDFQIVRKHASLRMVGSSKISGNILKFDDNSFDLSDSLIRIYSEKDKENEQLITKKNNNNELEQKKILCINISTFCQQKGDDKKIKSINMSNTQAKIIEPNYDLKVYEKAFELCNIICPDVFKMGKINGNRLDILRIKKHKCIMSEKIHDNENAFLIILKVGLLYVVRFGCYRYCNKKEKTYCLGDITIADNKIRNVESSLL